MTKDTGSQRYGSQRCAGGELAMGVHGRAGKWLDAMGLICGPLRVASRPSDGRPAVRAVGRVRSAEANARPRMPICDAARAARLRNSPAAEGLEAQCRA